jgi:hypothetical protein
MHALLRHGDTDRRYRTNSEVVMALALAAVNCGMPESVLYKLLLDCSNKGGQKVRAVLAERGERAAQRYLARAFQAAWKRYGQHAPKRPHAEAHHRAVDQLRRDADGCAWPGMAGARAVLQVHLDIADRVGSFLYSASNRQLAVAAGVDRRTVIRAHKRLVKARSLVCVRKGKGRRASTWRLCAAAPVTTICSLSESRGAYG